MKYQYISMTDVKNIQELLWQKTSIRTIAGVNPDDLDISITRDMVTIRGKREEHREVNEEDYFYRELYWGFFSRTILLPQEIEVDAAQASEKHGLLYY